MHYRITHEEVNQGYAGRDASYLDKSDPAPMLCLTGDGHAQGARNWRKVTCEWCLKYKPRVVMPSTNLDFARLLADMPVYLGGKPGSRYYVAGEGDKAAVVYWSSQNAAHVQRELDRRVRRTENKRFGL